VKIPDTMTVHFLDHITATQPRLIVSTQTGYYTAVWLSSPLPF
jgi:hypothetical protein